MNQLSTLKNRISKIEERNKKVEKDKAWETSFSRRILLIIFTYLTITLYMLAIGIKNPWLNAIIPAAGFLLSTLTLPFLKNLWIKYLYKK